MKPLLIISNDETLSLTKKFYDECYDNLMTKVKFLQKQVDDENEKFDAVKTQFFSDVEERLKALNIEYNKDTHYLRIKNGVIYSVSKKEDGEVGLPGILGLMAMINRSSLED